MFISDYHTLSNWVQHQIIIPSTTNIFISTFNEPLHIHSFQFDVCVDVYAYMYSDVHDVHGVHGVHGGVHDHTDLSINKIIILLVVVVVIITSFHAI